jgi:hypothetical protein
MDRNEVITILYKSLNGKTFTGAEKKALEEWIRVSVNNHQLYDEVMHSDTFRLEVKQMVGYDSKALWKKICADLS